MKILHLGGVQIREGACKRLTCPDSRAGEQNRKLEIVGRRRPAREARARLLLTSNFRLPTSQEFPLSAD